MKHLNLCTLLELAGNRDVHEEKQQENIVFAVKNVCSENFEVMCAPFQPNGNVIGCY